MTGSSSLAATAEQPLYAQVKDYVRRLILNGEWPIDHRIPSENDLVQALGASRMTVNRALRELTDDGWLRRVQGQGTFVSDTRTRLELLEIRNIADVIRSRGAYRCDVILHQQADAPEEIAEAIGRPPHSPVFHTQVVHFLDDATFQLEDRWVNPVVAPDYLGFDPHRQTPNEYLMRAAPLSNVEHRLEAVLPGALEQTLLRIDRYQPCLLLHRRTWSGGQVASRAWLTHPGDRFYLSTRFEHDDGDPAHGPRPDQPL